MVAFAHGLPDGLRISAEDLARPRHVAALPEAHAVTSVEEVRLDAFPLRRLARLRARI